MKNVKRSIDVSDFLKYKDLSLKYLRGSSIYSVINKSNLSQKDKDNTILGLCNFVSIYNSIRSKINNTSSLNELKNHEINLLNKSLKYFSLNKSSFFSLDFFLNNHFSNKYEDSLGRFNDSLVSIIEKDYYASLESQNRLFFSELFNYLSDVYFSQTNILNSLPLFMADIQITTSNKIKNHLNNDFISQFQNVKIKGLNFNFSSDLSNNYSNNGLEKITEQGNNNIYYLKKEKPIETFNDIGGLENQKSLIDRYIQAIKNPEIYLKNDARLSTSVLFYGPPGTGKSLLAKAMANELNSEFAKIRVPDITSKYFGESEKIIQAIFNEAKNNDRIILFFDEVDSISRDRGSSDSEASNRILTTLLDNLEDVNNYDNIVSVFATNKYDQIDSAFKRAGRISYIIEVPLPDELTRYKIFYKKIESSRKKSLERGGDGIFDKFTEKDYTSFIKYSNGFNGADITEIIERAKVEKSYKFIKENKNVLVNFNNLLNMIKKYERNNLII